MDSRHAHRARRKSAVRIAGILLLLYAQPLVRVAAIEVSAIGRSPDGLVITFGASAVPAPHPFDTLLQQHLDHRPNQRGANADSSWLFPGTRAGRHLHPNTIMLRLRALGINLRATRTTALRQLVSQAPPPVVATMLGYSQQVTHLHAAAIGEKYGKYVQSDDELT